MTIYHKSIINCPFIFALFQGEFWMQAILAIIRCKKRKICIETIFHTLYDQQTFAHKIDRSEIITKKIGESIRSVALLVNLVTQIWGDKKVR